MTRGGGHTTHQVGGHGRGDITVTLLRVWFPPHPPRIHYPLPLPYAGRPDPAALRKLVRELRDELAQLRARHGEDRRDAEIRRLRDE